jgi:hypothetical protein
MNSLTSVRRPTVLAAEALLALAGCGQTKSENPLSPSLAGPIAGVTISLPKAVDPVVGKKIKDAEQPVSLVIENPTSNSPRPFTLSVQIAFDGDFNNIVFAQHGITPSTDGLTRLRLPDRLQAGRIYHWRARADDGANASGWTAVQFFEVQVNVVIGTPSPRSPIANQRVTVNTPELVVNNGQSSGPHGVLRYQFQVSSNPTFTAIVGSGESFHDGATAGWVMNPVPGPDMILYWRARITDGEYTGAWSVTEQFRTPLPGGGGGGGGGGPTLPPSSCASNNGTFIVRCIEQKYPERLAAGVSANQRVANMEFLRDRIIESGICGGLDLAWNKKRGDGPHSHDALAWRTGGRDEVVDIGVAYDDTSRRLALSWGIVAGPAGYDPYPRPNCGF